MSHHNDARNPRKRKPQQMMMFKRALFALNKNESKPCDTPSCPAPKRARIIMDDSKECNPPTHSNTTQSPGRKHYRMNRNSHHYAHNATANSYTQPPPESPSRNFLHDRSRNTHQYRTKSMRHTPKTRLLSHRNRHNINNYNPNQTHNHKNYNHNNHSNTKYKVIEDCRMKKLWTDFHGDNEYMISELKFCRDTSFFITSNSIAHKISFVIKVLLEEYLSWNHTESLKILDALACIGGNSYSFAKIFNAQHHDIYCNELDEERCAALSHNMNVFAHYNVLLYKSRFHFYATDFLDLHLSLSSDICNKMDVVFLDPEWNNGDDYKQTDRGEIHLFDIGGLHLHQVIDNIVTKWYKNVKIVAIKLAKNYDQEFIHRKLQKCKLIEDKVFRIGQVSFHNQKLIVIVRNNDNKSFEDIFSCLPKMANRNIAYNSRDTITVKLLS